MDRIGEDFNRGPDARATGYHGKNSELTWVRKLKSQAAYDSSEDGDEPGGDMAAGDISQTSGGHRFDTGTGVTPISASSYHCDDLTLFLQEEIDPYELPTQAAANELFQCYLTTVHPSFPIIGKTTFVQQYNAYFNRLNQRKPNQNWLAILNIIFAIGARYSHLVRAESGGDAKDHLVYFTRARILGFNAHSILGHADLQRVQTAGLMAFYLMAVNQINR